MVPKNYGNDDNDSYGTSKQQISPNVTVKQKRDSSAVSKIKDMGMLFVRRKFRKLGIPRDAVKVIMKGWRESTKKQYSVYINKWLEFCAKEKWEPTDPNVIHCIQFLMSLYKIGYKYSALNSARSALSCMFSDPPIGEHKLICRFMRGVFNERPTKARYTEI